MIDLKREPPILRNTAEMLKLKGDFAVIKPPSAFPMTISFGGSDEKIVLHADGTYQGDVAELRKVMAKMTGFGDLSNAVLWLLLAEMERHPERRRQR